MNRREMLGTVAALASPSLSAAGAHECRPCVAANSPVPRSPVRRLRVKPVFSSLVHTDVWEGPCRFNVISVAQERENSRKQYAHWAERVQKGSFRFGPAVEMLQPHHVVFDEAFSIPGTEFQSIDREQEDIDAFFVMPGGSGATFATIEIAKRYHKPVVVFGLHCGNVDPAAYAKTVGEEVLVASDDAELESTLTLLRARTVYRETRVLFPTNRGFPAVASLTGITDLTELARKFGVEVRMISYKTLTAEVERTLANSERTAQAEAAAEDLIRGAAQTYLDRRYVVRSLLFKRAVESLMEENACNAFTIECFEFCASRLPQKWSITPCLIHTLFKDAGYASSCEADMGALLATRLLLSVSGKSSHMGNMFWGEDNSVIVNHSAPGIRMNGFSEPPLPYKLGRFVQSGWGTKAVVDFMNNGEKKATVARMHPDGDKLLVLRGTLIGSKGYEQDELGCSVQASIVPVESGDGRRFAKRLAEYGNHLSWVYGDYVPQLEELGRMTKFQVEVIS